MRWLRITALAVIALLCGAVIVLLLLGAREGAGRNQASIEIGRPASDVFPYLVEPAKLKAWVGGMVEAKALTEGGTRVGARGQTTVVDPHQREVRFVIDDEVIAFESNRLLALRMSSPNAFHGTVRYELVETGGKTQLSYIGEFQYEHWFARLMEPLITPSAQKKLEADLLTLKNLVESQNR